MALSLLTKRKSVESKSAHIDSLAEQEAPAQSQLADFIVCRLMHGSLQTLHVWRDHGRWHFEETHVQPSSGRRRQRGLRSNQTVIALLPKSQYLQRTLEVPRTADPDEVEQMLRLEANSLVPADFGPFELSYRTLLGARDGYARYELYFAKRQHVSDLVDAITASELSPDLVLPTAVLWEHVLQGQPSPRLAAIGWSDETVEAASRATDGVIMLRTVNRSNGNASSSLDRSLVECLRSIRSGPAGQNEETTVDWLAPGSDQRPSALEGVVFREPAADYLLRNGDGAIEPKAEAFALRLAAGILCRLDPVQLQRANLLPAEVIARRQRQTLLIHLLVSGGCIVLALLLAALSLYITVKRYQSAVAALESETKVIRTDGEAIGLKLDQLSAIRSARATRNLLPDLAAALYEATPQGVSYHEVDLDEQGQLRLRGQADSLSQVFLLPEGLEKHAMFKDVLMHDAGQSKKGEGSVAEFRLECKLERKEQP